MITKITIGEIYFYHQSTEALSKDDVIKILFSIDQYRKDAAKKTYIEYSDVFIKAASALTEELVEKTKDGWKTKTVKVEPGIKQHD